MVIIKRYLISLSVLLALLLAVSFFSSNQNFSHFFSGCSRIVASVTHPIESAVVWVKNSTVGLGRHYLALQNAEQLLLQIQKENMSLRAQILELQDVRTENIQLRSFLNLTKNSAKRFVIASVIGSDPLFSYKSIRIDRGSAQGLATGMGVMTAEGVVGVVMKVWSQTSDVLLLTDPNSNLDVLVLRNLRRGVLQGGIGHVMQFKYFDRGSLLLIGDEVVTSGLTGAFPSHVPVGRIIRILPEDANGISQTVDVEPVVDVSHLTNVLVLK